MVEQQTVTFSDVFSLRNNERMTFLGTIPLVEPTCHVLGIMRRSVSFPAGPHMDTVTTPENHGKPVMFEAIIACQQTKLGWVWVHLSPSTKEVIGSLTEQWGLPVDTWGFVGFEKA
mgnify:CR=1 FL=1